MIKKQAMENMLMIYPMSGTIDGSNGDHILLAPPFIIYEDHVVQITKRLASVIRSTIKSIPKKYRPQHSNNQIVHLKYQNSNFIQKQGGWV